MFFFGNTFYCDSREVISKDYGELIDRWAKENPKMKLGPFVHRKMEGSTVAEIEIRFGYPYVFMHLGNCEHLITFIEARYVNLQFTELNLKKKNSTWWKSRNYQGMDFCLERWSRPKMALLYIRMLSFTL